MWFEELTGIREAHEVVAGRLCVHGPELVSLANGRRLRWGGFELPSLGELRLRSRDLRAGPGPLKRRELVGDARALHAEPAAAGALFQVASQFNTLEMISPDVTPEQGIERYATDATQGPACAIACGAGTIYRNYLVPVGDGTGQRADRQLDGLADLAAALGIDSGMRNGYALVSGDQLDKAGRILAGADEPTRDGLRALLRIGLQSDTEVTWNGAGHAVTQAYCSALPVAYGHEPAERWAPLARLVLEAAYEATLAAAVVNAHLTGNPTVHLTLLGASAFGNPLPWVLDALDRACHRYADSGLDVAIVSYGRSNPALRRVLQP